MMENSKKIPEHWNGDVKKLKSGAALGAGTMGGGIAVVAITIWRQL